MSENYGFVITAQGRGLLATLLAGERLEITRVMVGEGRLVSDENPANLTDLIAPVAQGTSTVPVVENSSASFVVEYRSDLNGGLDRAFWLSEYGVFALDKNGGEVMIYYASLGGYPQHVAAFNSGAIDIRRFPVVLNVGTDAEVVLGYPADAFMTSEEVAEFVKANVMLMIDSSAKALIDAHNADTAAHPDMRSKISDGESRIQRLEDMILNDVSGNPFMVKFDTLDGVTVSGVWNNTMGRIEF